VLLVRSGDKRTSPKDSGSLTAMKIKGMNEAQFLSLLKKVLPKATRARAAGHALLVYKDLSAYKDCDPKLLDHEIFMNMYRGYGSVVVRRYASPSSGCFLSLIWMIFKG
jgi:hypothetical protein